MKNKEIQHIFDELDNLEKKLKDKELCSILYETSSLLLRLDRKLYEKDKMISDLSKTKKVIKLENFFIPFIAGCFSSLLITWIL